MNYIVFVGRLCSGIVLIALAILLSVTHPLQWVTRYMLRMSEGSTLYRSVQSPDYVVHESVYVFNYTNVDRFMKGLDPKLKVEEVGPFVFQEVSEGLNMSIDHTKNILRVTPRSSLIFLPELSVGSMHDLRVVSPNLVMVVLGTLGADTLPSWSNHAVSLLMKSVGSEPFLQLSVEELLWGYKDPLVDIASTYFPGWIDFSIVGVLKLFYGAKLKELELDLNPETFFSIRNLDGSPGLKEQSYKGPGTENYCNTLRGAFPGTLVTPSFPRDQTLGIFKYQGCKVYPFVYDSQGTSSIDVPYYRFKMAENAFNSSGAFACSCRGRCAPNGLADISQCYYGFPAYLSLPHYFRADPEIYSAIDGLSPDPERAAAFVDFDPVTGVPLNIHTSSQTNLRVNISPYNSAMKPFRTAQYLPIIWLNLKTPFGPPEQASSQLRLLHVHAPRLLLATRLLLLLLGTALVLSGVAASARGLLQKKIEMPLDKDTSRQLLSDIIHR